MVTDPRLSLSHRLAGVDDLDAIKDLMAQAIRVNMAAFLSDDEITAATETMGVDQTLIADKTYFLIYYFADGKETLVGCGGWGKRKTLYGGDHTPGRDATLLDPKIDAARIRAMYTHPDWTRRGVGSYLLDLGEQAARDAGFEMIELGSTLAGEPLYRATGYRELTRHVTVAENGAKNVIIHMRKEL